MGGFSPNIQGNKTVGDGFTMFDPFSTEPNTVSTTQVNTGSGLAGLDDIFGTKSTNQVQGGFDIFNMTNMSVGQTTNNTQSPFDTDIFGGGSINTNTSNSSNTNNNYGGINVDLFGGGISMSNNTTNNNDKVVFSNSELKITCQVNKESSTQMNINYSCSNLSSKNLTNVKLTFLAPKNVTVKVNSTSGNTLDPNQTDGIRKELLITNDSNKQVVLKLKISYNVNGEEINESITLSDF